MAIILAVFCLGYMMGELHGMIRSFEHHGYRDSMMYSQGTDADGYYGPGMMDTVSGTTQTVPATPAQ